jgi:ribulose-phosphate 3-epimerase
MRENPENLIGHISKAGANQCKFHVEATKVPANLITKIHQNNVKAGIALKPSTPIEILFPFVEDISLILVMTVELGFGSQKFKLDMMGKWRS